VTKRSQCRGLAAVLLVLFPLSGWACPTSLNLMPTADLLEAGTLRLGLEKDGYPRAFGPECESYFQFQAGLTPRLAAGLDLYHYDGQTKPAVNAKYLLAQEGRYPQVALGVSDVCRAIKPFWYVVLSRDVGAARLHAGAARVEGTQCALLGAEFELRSHLSLLADWRSGPEGYATAGIWWEQGALQLGIAVGFPNATGEDRLVLVNLSRALSLAR
jgi:hypothetical protein